MLGKKSEIAGILISGLRAILKILETSSMRKALEHFFLRTSLDADFDEVFASKLTHTRPLLCLSANLPTILLNTIL